MKIPFPFSIVIFFLHVLLLAVQLTGQEHSSGADIHGSVVDAETGQPLPGANITIIDGERGAASDGEGRFSIPSLAPGSYRLRASFIGYETRVLTDVVVRPGRKTEVELRLHPSAYESEEVVITAGYFTAAGDRPVSTASFSGEEIRRSPGSAGDVSRIMMALPSVAKVNDQSNSLIVRGGSPLENTFYVDGIEIPNINHFPAQGASGGPLGMLPVDLIRDVSFLTGGFPVPYGDKLSAVMDISLREGSRDGIEGQADMNFTGFGGLLEGPLGSRGSWLLSARRSYLDLLVSAIDIGTSVAPWYGDAHAKLVYDLSDEHRISLVGLWSDDHNNPDAETAVENDMQHYGSQEIYNYTGGLTWRALWNASTFSQTSLSYTGQSFREHGKKTGTDLPIRDNVSGEHWLQLRSETRTRLSPRLSLNFGGDAKILFNSYDNRYHPMTDPLGNPVPGFTFDKSVDNLLTGLHATAEITPLPVLRVTAGLRAQYNDWNRRVTWQPRGSLAWQVTPLTTVSAAGGVYTQSLPLLLLAQDDANRALPDPQALHGVVSIAHLLSESTRLTLEGYVKEYDHFPVDITQPELFLVDEMTYSYGYFMPHGAMNTDGTAFSRGLELTLQKKLAQDIYGLASASYSTSRYTDAMGDERPRVYDNRLLFSVEGGYKPSAEWEFSLRWIYAGGAPYTPLDVEASRVARQEVLDGTRINGERHPDYHSMNVRVDRRFNFDRSSLVVYLSIWNVYDRRNVAGYLWDVENERVKTLYQWGMLPIFGIEWEF